MRSVLLWKDMDQVAEQMDAAVFQLSLIHISEPTRP